MEEAEIIAIVAEGMGLLEGMKFGPRGRGEVVMAARRVASVLGQMSWRPEDIDSAARRAIATLDEYPSAHQFKDCLQWAIDRRKQMEVSKFVRCVDADGTVMMAPPERVLDGNLLPMGSTHGNGAGYIGEDIWALPERVVDAAILAEREKRGLSNTEPKEIIITDADLDRRDAMIAQLRAGR